MWHELFDAGRIDYHPVFPGKPGFAARLIEDEADVLDVIAMLRLNYDRVVAKHGFRRGARKRRPAPVVGPAVELVRREVCEPGAVSAATPGSLSACWILGR